MTSSNRGVAYVGPGRVEVQPIPFPKLEDPRGRRADSRALMQAILWDRIDVAGTVGVEVISLDDAPRGYEAFDAGTPKKFVIDPHGMLAAA